MRDFKDLNVWKESHELVRMIYLETNTFPESEKFGITSQIRRAATSVPTNISEGCGRRSKKDLARFLEFSLGSAQEVEYLLILSRDLKYLNEKEYLELNDKTNKVKAMLINFHKGL